jgi:soluble lytic murein transglycosylase-like protein
MTRGSSFAFPGFGELERVLALGRRRISVAPLLGLLSLVMLSASTVRLDAVAAVASRPPAARTGAPKVVTEARQVRLLGSNGATQNIAALAGVIAKRYRISEDATRELVGTAYAEGASIGIDPLLIVAVMAVESRFNPIAQSEGGAMGLMQVIPRFHADKFDATNRTSVLEPHTNIQVGARILKEYISRGGTEVAGLQLYNGSLGDASNAYSNRVLVEKQWLQDAIRRARDHGRA